MHSLLNCTFIIYDFFVIVVVGGGGVVVSTVSFVVARSVKCVFICELTVKVALALWS